MNKLGDNDPPTVDESVDRKLQVYMEEYRQTRAEINIKQQHIHALTNFALLLVGASVGAISTAKTIGEFHLYVMLLAPILLAFLGLLFAYEGELMAVASGYIHTSIRSRIAKLLEMDERDVLPWEDYKSNRTIAIWLLYDLARWLMFALPSFMFMCGYLAYAPEDGVLGSGWLLVMGCTLNALLVVLFAYRLRLKAKLLRKPQRIGPVQTATRTIAKN